MHHAKNETQDRIARFFRDVLQPALTSGWHAVEVLAWEAPGEPVPFPEAVAEPRRPMGTGQPWGRPWSTWWFEISGVVPEHLRGQELELQVDLGFAGGPGFTCEALAYRPDGTVVKGINPENRWLPVSGQAYSYLLEAGANPDLLKDGFSPTRLGDPATAGTEPLFRLGGAWLVPVDQGLRTLALEARLLWDLMHETPEENPRRFQILRALDAAVTATDPQDVPGSVEEARAILAPALAARAAASAHVVHAVGNAHIDTAWLWPLRETRRKCARTFANALNLLDTLPGYSFTASAALHHAWLREDHPALFARVREAVSAGRWHLVGGQWVEADGNLCGGEALARQFVHGQRWFAEHLGRRCEVMWLPDSFGYTAAYPQIARLAGCRWFLTQKLSWNGTNRFPHHSFWWEGIDGTRVFTHFPPVDTYNASLVPAELRKAERQYAEKGAANTSLVPYGYGDGGGGPTREMVQRARLLHNLDGMPRVKLSSPAAFFEAAETEYPGAPTWRGELYMEGHRGTLTSQLGTKQGNRRSEHLLREAELAAATAHLRTGRPYPYELLEECWREVLTLQFHDILPGSSIAWVHDEAEQAYQRLARRLEHEVSEALAVLGDGVFTARPHTRRTVLRRGDRLELIDPSTGADARPEHPVTVGMGPDGIVLANGLVTATIAADGTLSSLLDPTRREVIPAGQHGAVLQLHRDAPNHWDAWDVDRHYLAAHEDLLDAESVRLTEQSSLRATVEVRRSFGASQVIQRYTLDADSPRLDLALDVSWQERKRMLKLAFPCAVMADEHRAEIQFGHVRRPTHENTSWDWARFEVAAHRWVRIGEEGFGVAVANDSSYGHDIRRGHDAQGRPMTTVRVSLLRSAAFPDPDQDRGFHSLAVSLVPGAGVPDAIEAGYALNLPVRLHGGPGPLVPLVTSSAPGAVVEAVKLAEDRSGDVIVRVYEALGGTRETELSLGFPTADVTETDLLEEEHPSGAVLARQDTTVRLRLRPFQIVTLRIRRS